MKISENIEVFNDDCLNVITQIESNSIDCICTDPPYLYLKNQKLEREFDEILFFNECKRILKSSGFIVLFGRGTSFYRWNTILSDLGFIFKEEIIWNKSLTTSPMLPLSRIHETISLHTIKGKINKIKIPYIESRNCDINAIKDDIKRIKTVFNNKINFDAITEYLETHIRKDYKSISTYSTHRATLGTDRLGMRVVTSAQFIKEGLTEKSIIKLPREHYGTIHPTQKPIELIQRLLRIVTNNENIVFDPFAGSFSTGIACFNLGLRFIGCEIDNEYFNSGINKLKNEINGKLF